MLFDAGFGDLFVVRNAGNTCTSASIASLEYSIQALNIELILVIGHEGCGAVTAACHHENHLSLQLLELVRQIRDGLDEVDPRMDLQTAFRQNPIQASRHVVRGSALLRQRLKTGQVLLEAAYYTLRRGELEWLGRIDANGEVLPGTLTDGVGR